MRKLAFVLLLLLPASASARLTNEYSYSYDQVWRATVRLIAVDFRFPVGERDPDIGYLLFEYRENGRSYAGSVELVRGEGETSIRVVVQIGAMPSYVERMILDRLSRKLVEEYGVPRRPTPAQPPAPPAHDDDDDQDDEEEPAPATP